MTDDSRDGGASARRGPLAGTRVVELASFITGPYTGLMLADLGADVIKIEQPKGGDAFRRFGRPATYVSPVFANCNRGKRSMVLDLKAEGGVATLLRLLTTTDILVCNWRPDVAERLGLGDHVLEEANPRLIRMYISGFGPAGPNADEPAFDNVLQARSGLTQALWAGEEPTILPGYPIDKMTAVMAAQAALAALLSRQRDGRGDRIDLAMLDAAGYLNFIDLFTNRVFVDHQPAEARNLHASSTRPLAASDGWLIIAPVSGEAIRNACVTVGHPDWADEVLPIADQVTMVRLLFDRMESVMPTDTVANWLSRFQAHDVPAAPCLSIDEHLDDPQVAHNQMYSVTEWPDVGKVRSARYPARFASTGPLAATGAAPRLGANTDEILAELDTRAIGD